MDHSSKTYRIHSVFEHAINLMDQAGTLYTLLSRDHPNGPNTAIMNVEDFYAFDFEQNECFQSGQLIISPVTLDWSFRSPSDQLFVDNHLINFIADYIEEKSEEKNSVEEKIYQILDHHYDEMKRAFYQQDWRQFTMHLTKTIGLGLGLTPSGDDRLVGLSLIFSIPNSPLYPDFHRIQTIISEAGALTNEISYAVLKHASKGRFNEWLNDLQTALIDKKSEENLKVHLDHVASIGSRSGIDMLTGVLHGLMILEVVMQSKEFS